ncbi:MULTISPECIES: hypothetical protein [Methylobacterium]|jgi:hypothetical protein|uniref:Uncharacterized protein n=1 Tax=Methylobacterium brachiatum TaxID=269660 RepID=A0AAJ1TRN3_9HYPH|nr:MULTISPECIES: hypothetical protein [Methylobacterium]AYO83710.1 hypothetical protein EBB05_16500 [Methylobacterium brachiatum]EIZ83724.1 hypothetical protein WYO_3737 [Methylobacterium sp. GXF4]MCB4803487.1 hypothetical protein [Methylobacterium brachiatum]MDF2600088.1 hypothetical protein [Methylobacterium brachiatum]MDH2311400.1 hypothetical protein [Methylobacterium brachiatum]
MKAKSPAVSSETLLVSVLVLLSAAMLFEWMVISPDNPGYALLRVIGAAVAAFVAIMPFRRA